MYLTPSEERTPFHALRVWFVRPLLLEVNPMTRRVIGPSSIQVVLHYNQSELPRSVDCLQWGTSPQS
jgi:hypothetical protein